MPEFDEGVLGWWVGRDIDDGWTVVRVRDGFVRVIAVVVVPVEGQVIAWLHFDGVGRGDVAHHIATHVDGVEIFDRRVGVAASVGRGIVSRSADSLEETLVYTVDEYAL